MSAGSDDRSSRSQARSDRRPSAGWPSPSSWPRSSGRLSRRAALSMTFDEPHHLATGIEWWQFGTYRWWTENPPLPKVVTALGPYLAGVRLPGSPATLGSRPWPVGINLLDDGGARILMLARAGTTVFLLLTLWLTFTLAG